MSEDNDYLNRLIEKDKRLLRIQAGIQRVLYAELGESWRQATSEDRLRLLTIRQRAWSDAEECHSHLNGYVDEFLKGMTWFFEIEEYFQEIGARGILEAAADLKGLHQEFLQLKTEEEQDRFLDSHKEEMDAPLKKIEDEFVFADLLFAYAEKYPEEFKEADPLPHPLAHAKGTIFDPDLFG